jgi:hypothetical protein
MKTFGFLVIIKQGLSTTPLEKLRSWILIYTPIRRFVNILATFLCPSFTGFRHVLMLRIITASQHVAFGWNGRHAFGCLRATLKHLLDVSKCDWKLKLKSVWLKNQHENLATLCTETYLDNWGTRWRSWLGHGATIRKVKGSLKFFIDKILPAALSIQSVTGMSTRNISCG